MLLACDLKFVLVHMVGLVVVLASMAPFLVIIVIIIIPTTTAATTTTMMRLPSTFRHVWPPILLQLRLGLLKVLASLLLLLGGIGITQLVTGVVDVCEILAQLLAMRAVSITGLALASSAAWAAVASSTATTVVAASSWMVVTLVYVSLEEHEIEQVEQQHTSPILVCFLFSVYF